MTQKRHHKWRQTVVYSMSPVGVGVGGQYQIIAFMETGVICPYRVLGVSFTVTKA